jgi:AraC family transcriptional regulator
LKNVELKENWMEPRTPPVSHRPAQFSAALTAADEIGRIIDTPPPLVSEVLRGDTRLTLRWGHGPLHDHLVAMSGHVLMTYYGAAQHITWRSGGQRLISQTRPGSVTLIPDGHDGHWDIGGPIEVSHVYLTGQRLQACADQLADGRRIELVDRVGFDDPATSRILELLSQEAVTDDPASRLFVEQAIDLLCTQLIRRHSSLSTQPPEQARRGLADWQMKRVTNYMIEHLDEDIGLDELAALASLSRFHFCTAFRLATGQTPHNWLTAMRMQQARRLLAEQDLPIIHVALAVGYQTPSAFAATFRNATGVTPSAFRRAL